MLMGTQRKRALCRHKGCKILWSWPKVALSVPDRLRQLMGQLQSREECKKSHTKESTR